MAFPTLSRLGEAASDPKPDNNMGEDLDIAGTPHHWVWSNKTPGKLALHKGFSAKCRRVHYRADGTKFEAKK